MSAISPYSSFNVHGDVCHYYSSNDFNSNLSATNENFFLLNFNIRSFNSNFDDFSAYLSTLKTMPDAIILTETWFIGQNSSEIAGYYGYHCNRDPNIFERGGGVSVYLKSSIKAKITIENTISAPEMELMHLKLNLSTGKKIHMLAIYRPPNSTLTDMFFNKIDEILEKIPISHQIFLAGDLNIDGLTTSTVALNFMDVMRTYCMKPHIILPTRPNRDGINSTQIDHIWSNITSNCTSGIFNDALITDHFPNFTLIPMEIVKATVKKSFRDHSDSCIELMIDRVANFVLFFPLLTATLDYNSKFSLFYDELLRIYKTSCPLRTKNIPSNGLHKPWINKRVRLKILRKHYLFKRYKAGAIVFDFYNKFKQETEKFIKNARIKYFRHKYDMCHGNSRETWKISKNILNINKSLNTSYSIEHNGCPIEDESEMCNFFNAHFIEVGQKLANGIVNSNTDPLSYLAERNNNSCFFVPTDEREVHTLLNSFQNKNSSLSNIPVYVMKRISHLIAPIIADLFNESIQTGIFPECLKLGRVVPLFKSGSRNSVSNYRPITTLSVLSKVFEKLVHKRMIYFVNKNNILKNNQFGFQKGKCTSDAILEFLNNANDSLNNKNYLISIFLDFSKAFDTISHEILLQKLDRYGFRGTINTWLRSYLHHRKQYVSVGKINSDVLETVIGVPQGSTLGPLLFLIYIADMQQAFKSMKVIHYADDSTLYFSFPKNNDCAQLVNTELKSLSDWLSANKLFLNVTKTKYMVFHNIGKPPDVNISINELPVERTEVHKFLGIHIDDRLTFSTHAQKLCSKISQKIGIIRKISNIVPGNVLKQLHFAFIHSGYTYGITTYGTATISVTKKLSKLVDKSLKMVLGIHRITPDVCKAKKMFNFSFSHQYFTCIKMHQILVSKTHRYFLDLIQSTQPVNQHRTRFWTSERLILPYMRFSKCQNSFFYIGLKLWNKLPVALRNIKVETKFKNKLKEFIFS